MFEYIKFYFKQFKSSKFIRKGKCLQCGKCCKNILFYIGDEPVKDENQFEKMKQWDKRYYGFYISGKDENGALLFTCNKLGSDNKCSVYFMRGLVCRNYPNPASKFLINGGKPIEGCGFYFEPDKTFKSYLNKT